VLCYALYRVARLWLTSQAGAVAAAAMFDLSTMVALQDWIHLNIAAGTVFLPVALEAAVRLQRRPGIPRALRLGSYVRLGRGEEGTGGRDKSSILADTLEALIGAVYFECGLAAADGLVHRLFDPVIDRSAGLGAGLDWKTSLQELTASGVLGVPEYHVEESGPDHQKFFRASVRVGGRTYGSGSGRSKKEAEQQAAEAAWKAISDGTESGDAATNGAARTVGGRRVAHACSTYDG